MKHYQQISIICSCTILIDYNIEIDYKFEDMNTSNAYCKQLDSTYYIVFAIMDHKLYLQTLC